MEWLPLAVLGIMWAAFLLPTEVKIHPRHGSVEDFERRMELLAQAETHGTEGRWIVTPRKGVRFLGHAERQRARSRERRRQVFTFLLESIGISFLIGARAAAARRLGRDRRARRVARRLRLAAAHAQAPRVHVPHLTRTAIRRPTRPRRGPPHRRATSRTAGTRGPVPSFNGLGTLGEGDRVHVVVHAGGATAGA